MNRNRVPATGVVAVAVAIMRREMRITMARRRVVMGMAGIVTNHPVMGMAVAMRMAPIVFPVVVVPGLGVKRETGGDNRGQQD